MSAFRDKHRYFSYYGKGGNDPLLEQCLINALCRLRVEFIDYQKRRRLDDFKGVNQEVSQAYNSLLWSINLKKKRRNQFVKRTLDEYFAVRQELFSTYYDAKNKREIDYSKRYFFDGLEDIELHQVRHTLKQTKVVYRVEVELPKKEYAIQLERVAMYTRHYIEFCVKFKCENDKMIQKLAPDKLDIFGLIEIVTLIRIFSEAKTLTRAKEMLKNRWKHRL